MSYNHVCTCDQGFAPNRTGHCKGEIISIIIAESACPFENHIFVDVDECQRNSHNCSKNARCMNKLGSFDCQCEVGYDGDGMTCTRMSLSASKRNSINIIVFVYLKFPGRWSLVSFHCLQS